MIRTKSVYSQPDTSDGLRILATRFLGRGRSSDLYDVWMPSLGPSEQLLGRVLKGRITWAAFAKAFRKELCEDGPVDARSKTIKNHEQKFTLRSSTATGTS